MKKYIVVEAGWDMDAHPYVYTYGPFAYGKARGIFDDKLMSWLGISPDGSSDEELSDYMQQYGKATAYDEYAEHYLLQMNEVAEAAK